MTALPDPDLQRDLLRVFRMPSVQTMVSRKSSITNAFVSAIIPVIPPTAAEIEEAINILGLDHTDLRCAYCGDKSSEWDHLRPLVLQRRPTGYVSEIANLVPCCGKCNQSKGNKNWRTWMTSAAKWSPGGRGIPDLQERIERLEEFEGWRRPTRVDFEGILGHEEWEAYWQTCEELIQRMNASQRVADQIKSKIGDAIARCDGES